VSGGTRVASCGYLDVSSPLKPAGGRPPRPGPGRFTRSCRWKPLGMSASAQWPAQHSELIGMLYGSVFLDGGSSRTFSRSVSVPFFARAFSIFFTTAMGICWKCVREVPLTGFVFMTGEQ